MFQKGNQLWKLKKKFKHTEKSKLKMALSQKGKNKVSGLYKETQGFQKEHIPWNKGLKGLMPTPWNKGKKLPQLSGKNHHFFNKHHSKKSNEKNRQSHLGKATWNKGKNLSEKHRINLSIAHSKEEIFTGFKEIFNKRIRLLSQYTNWRMMVFGRDNFTCQECGVRGVYLEAHHNKSFARIIKENNIKTIEQAIKCKELWDVDNGKTLCTECHIIEDYFRETRKKVNVITKEVRGD